MIQKHKTRKFHKTRYIAMGTYVGKTYCSLIKTVLVFFSLTCKFVSSQEIQKPGKCPGVKPFSGSVCQWMKFLPCLNDEYCFGANKCCFNGCGLSCQRPVLDCSTESCIKPDCEITHVPKGKCCPICGPVNIRNINVKYSHCGPIHCQCCPFCKPDCLNFICPKIKCLPGDSSYIPFGQCCPVCAQDKPGVCPVVAGKNGICVEACSNDNNCPRDQKCCSTGCGRTCQAPISQACPNGQNGICGTIAGKVCPAGTECMFMGNYPDASGKCCIKNPKPITACIEPLMIGPCRGAFPRYFYNKTSCKCERFSWGGCQPNGNNFFDIAYCQASCEKPMQSNPICKLDKEKGFCKTNWNLNRWRFNRFSCKCELYQWHECVNANKFPSKDACESSCGCYNCKGSTNICDLPIKPNGGDPVCLAYIPSYGYNSKTCRCEKFIYSGCGGNENRFSTLALCERRCGNSTCERTVKCNQPADEGRCNDKIIRYFYDTKACKCEQFIWTGCGGNSNNFKTLAECMSSCEGEPCGKPKPNCLLPKEIGPCEALIERYYFDKIECKCKMFNYGGCGGNSNNFPTLSVCKQSCRKTTCPVCNLRAETGPCKAAFKRYFYNTKTCQCEEFTYGGCGGNGNRYDTKTECENMCGSYPCAKGCLEPKTIGPCKAAIKRFYYNAQKHKCERFSWRGCQPNGNNFESRKFCNKVCKDAVCSLPLKVGPCKGRKKRYYYNSNTRNCEAFYWGGCDSNGNNFKSAKSCRKACF